MDYGPIVMCLLRMDKKALCGHFYSYVDPVWLLYNIGTGCHVITHVVFLGRAPRTKETLSDFC